MIKSIYNYSRTIRYPISYISKISKVKKAYDDFLTKNQREPNSEELMNLTNLTQRQYNSTIMDKSYCQSLDTPISSDGEMTVEDVLVYEDNNRDPFTRDSVKNCLKILNSREKLVITKFYGLEDGKEWTIKEIAEELNLGEERVRQLRKNAIKKLKERCGNILKNLL